MKSVFEKIIEELEACKDIMLSPNNSDCFGEECKYNDCMVCVFAKAIEIVKQEAGMCNNAIIDGKYCFQTCACTEKCDKCSRLCNGDIDWYENLDDWLYQPKGE